MAFNPAPTEVFAGWSEDGTDITLPIANVPELTAAEADAVTGDSRKILFALIKEYAAWFGALATADKPGNLTITEGNAIENSAGNFNKSFSIQFVLAAPTGLDVADEV